MQDGGRFLSAIRLFFIHAAFTFHHSCFLHAEEFSDRLIQSEGNRRVNTRLKQVKRQDCRYDQRQHLFARNAHKYWRENNIPQYHEHRPYSYACDKGNDRIFPCLVTLIDIARHQDKRPRSKNVH